MMSRRKTMLVLCGATLIALAGLTQAQEPAVSAEQTGEERAALREQMRSRYEQMTPEEREARREKLRERRESMTAEEREARLKEAREQFEAMSPEEQKAFRQQMMGGKSRHHRHFMPARKCGESDGKKRDKDSATE